MRVGDGIGGADRAWAAAHHPGDAMLRQVDARVGPAADDCLAVAAWLWDRTGG
ncbi:hypothetical protein GCM10023235_05760 [Kitasatospora terrestris]|uniref:Uncharacterized protein n=1 Tax=Kitasatospora terrestris TaxID=258051 RepID=A0ABP9D9H1_9ACTN